MTFSEDLGFFVFVVSFGLPTRYTSHEAIREFHAFDEI